MVLARVANVKSGWKSVFMVFTTAAADESPQIVRLAFDTVEKIVREHFHYITGQWMGRKGLGGWWSVRRGVPLPCDAACVTR